MSLTPPRCRYAQASDGVPIPLTDIALRAQHLQIAEFRFAALGRRDNVVHVQNHSRGVLTILAIPLAGEVVSMEDFGAKSRWDLDS